MPQREKPHLMRVRVINPDGTSEIKTVRADQIKQQPQHLTAVLTDEQVGRARKLWDAVGKVARPDIDLSRWVEGFKFERDPDGELGEWEHIARVFEKVGGPSMVATQKTTTLKAILGISTGTVDVESQTGLTSTAVQRLRERFNSTE